MIKYYRYSPDPMINTLDPNEFVGVGDYKFVATDGHLIMKVHDSLAADDVHPYHEYDKALINGMHIWVMYYHSRHKFAIEKVAKEVGCE